jgi:hypothetical protein
MSFWIYENFPSRRTTIHEGSCGFCHEGKGKAQPRKGDANGKWHGPIVDLEKAVQAAALLKREHSVHSCCRKNARLAAQVPYKRFAIESVDERSLSLEQLFTLRMEQIYVTLRDEIDYKATRFLTSVHRHGGVGHAKRSLRREVQLQAGFERLRDEGRLHQSMEASVVDPQYQTLFTPAEIAEARRRLSAAQAASVK